MHIRPPLPRRRTRAVALVLFVGLAATMLRAADPVPFPPSPAPDPHHTPPKLIHRVDPTCPADHKETQERRVYVAFLVAPDGSVKKAAAMFDPPAPLAAAAVEAVSQWKFEPGRISAHQRPVWTQMTVELWFKPAAAVPPPST